MCAEGYLLFELEEMIISQTHIYSSLRSWVKKCLEQIPPPLPPPSSLHPSLIPFENLYQFNNLYFRSLYFVFSKCIFLCRPRPSCDWWWTRYTSRRWLPLDGWCLLHRKILNLTSAIKYELKIETDYWKNIYRMPQLFRWRSEARHHADPKIK